MELESMSGRMAGIVVIDRGTIRVVRSAAFEAPKAAIYLAEVPDEVRLEAIEDLLEHGAAAASLAQTSAHVVMLEAKVAELATQLGANLAKQLQEAGEGSTKETRALLEDHKQQLTKLLGPLTDVNAKDGLPTKMVELLELSNRHALKQVEAILAEGDEGVIGRAVKVIVDQVKESSLALTNEIASRRALLANSVHRGGVFEDVLAARLPILAMPIGRIEHCARTAGDRAGKVGDCVIVLNEGGGTLRIAIEAKSQKTSWSTEKVRQELKAVRANRACAAAILVAESADMLPGKAGFGQVSPIDFVVAFNPEVGDMTALMCGLSLAKVAALASVDGDSDSVVDIPAAAREVSLIRTLLDQFSKIEGAGSKIEREVANIRICAADIRGDIHTALRRLDSILGS